MLIKVPLAGLPQRCHTCLMSCVLCPNCEGETRLAMARILLDLVERRLPWFPDWQKLEELQWED